MIKKPLAIMLAFTLLLAACAPAADNGNGNGYENGTAATAAAAPSRGIWDGDVYTNTYLGLSFTLPEGWQVLTDEEVAEMMGIGVEALGEAGAELPADFWDGEAADLTDMSAVDMYTGAQVSIMFEKLDAEYADLTEAEYIELVAETLEAMGMVINLDFPGTTRIGNYDWHVYGSEIDMFGMVIYGRYFINAQDGFMRTIMIVYSEMSESAEEILANFGTL